MKMMAEIRVWEKFPIEYLKYIVGNFHVKDDLNNSYNHELCYGARFCVEFESLQYRMIQNI